MANLTKNDIKELKSVGIVGIDTVEEAREFIINKLENDYDTPGMQDEELGLLIDIYKVFVTENQGEDEEDDEEDEYPQSPDEPEEDEDEDEEEDDEEEELPEEEDDEELESEENLDALAEEATKTKAEVKKSADKRKAEEAASKPAKKPAASKRTSNKLDPQNNEEDRKPFDYFRAFFPELTYEFDWVKNAGVSIKYKGENAKRGVLLIEAACRKPDGSITCNCYFNTMTKNQEVMEDAGYEVKRSWNNVPFIAKVTFEEVLEALNQFEKYIKSKAENTDKKLGENRKKLERELNKKG